jgi:hypothetical protein
MVFATTNLFKTIPCPEGSKCLLTHCIFSHDLQPQQAQPAPASVTAPQPVKETTSRPQPDTSEPATKRRKITYGSLAEKPLSRADQIRSQLAAVRSDKSHGTIQSKQNDASLARSVAQKPVPATSNRAISPPIVPNPRPNPPSGAGGAQQASNGAATKLDAKAENLNPRLIPHDPAGHATRSRYLKVLHGEVARLNKEASGKVPRDLKGQLPLSEQAVIKLVLDEEEKIARDQPSVYGNVIKQRLFQLKKISVDDWITQIRSVLPSSTSQTGSKDEKPIDTRMNLDEEVLILPHLITDQSKLVNFEYISVPPSSESIASAVAGVEQSQNYEECDRCAARFQVFPDRNDVGLLSSNGPCRYHPNRKVFPPRQKTDHQTGSQQAYYPCCMETVGAAGCTENDDHVFKTTSPNRLAAVLPFITTPDNDKPRRDRDGKVVKAVTFDCEMGYTVYGMELIRLTAVSWPDNKDLLDVLVRPLGAVIDLNSRFSGVFPEHFRDAIPYDDWKPSSVRGSKVSSNGDGAVTATPDNLPIVDSPNRARSLLCSFLTPNTPLLGHAINNDLNAVRLCHPTIIDTVVLYPHPRGLPMRLGLRALSQRILNRAIQTGGARGHDSREDAVTTGDLVRVKVGEKWRQMRATGWRLENGKIIPPVGKPQSDGNDSGLSAAVGDKRKRELDDAREGESTF